MVKIAFTQFAPVVGCFDANIQKIKEYYERACSMQARLLLTPELGVCGYPPYDLIDRPEMVERNNHAIAELMKLTEGQHCALVVGHIALNPSSFGKAVQNVVSVLENGRKV